MSPAHWLTADTRSLLAFLEEEKLLARQSRQVCLFCHACCTRLLPRHPLPIYLRALEIMREAAEGKMGFDDLNRIGNIVMRLEDDLTRILAFGQALSLCFGNEAVHSRSLSELAASVVEMRGANEDEPVSNIVRDIFGNMFYRVAIDPRWLSSTVLDLARTIDNEGCYERLPILADALMDAGCDDETLLRHCQQRTEHVKGCWAIDLLLLRSPPFSSPDPSLLA
jgi:hypothetical protein